MDVESRIDARVAALAAGSHGVVTRGGLLAAGVGRREIEVRVARGGLIHVHRGVFRVGHAAPSTLADCAAAVLACGERAALAGLAAAHLHRLTRTPPPSPICVLTPTERRVPGVRTRRSRVFREEEVTVERGIRVTTVPRTLVDLAGDLSPAALARACHEAGVRHRTTPADVAEILERLPSAPGRAALWRVMSGEEKVTLSALERAFLRALRGAGLPLPDTNRPAGGRRVDCRWPAHRLTVELDSYGFHNTRHAWEQDRRREREAYARGDAFRRFTWLDVVEHPGAMLAELRPLLS